MKKFIVIAALVLAFAAGVAVPAATAQTIPPARYQVIADITTMAGEITQLKRDVVDLQSQVAVLQLLRAHDVNRFDVLRANDLLVSAAQRRDLLDQLYRLQLVVYDDMCLPTEEQHAN